MYTLKRVCKTYTIICLHTNHNQQTPLINGPHITSDTLSQRYLNIFLSQLTLGCFYTV